MAPYCAIPRDYLSDTPLLCAMGFLVSQHSQLAAIPPLPFLSVSPLGEHAKWGCDTPPPKGYLSDTRAIPYENKANGCDTRQEFYTPPLFIHPPPLGGYFQGGGWGCIKSGPVFFFFFGAEIPTRERLHPEKRLIRSTFLRHVLRGALSVRPKCSHRCASLKESPLKPVLILKDATSISTEQTSMRTKGFKHIAI